MAFKNVAELGQILADNTRVHTQFIHKTTHADGVAAYTIDMSMAPGIPKYNAYVGNQIEFTPMAGAGNFGIYTGEAEAGRTKYLTHFWLQTLHVNNTPGTFILLDYIGFYPLIDFDSTDQQDLDNSAGLPRYVDGEGLRMMMVTTTPSTANSLVTITYTNQAGVSGRVTTFFYIAAPNTGNVLTAMDTSGAANNYSPFISLAAGDTGVRSVQSVQFSGSAGGFGSLVLVRPLEQITLLELATVTELDLLMHRGRVVPIADDAYLNLILSTSGGSITPAILRGGITIVRN